MLTLGINGNFGDDEADLVPGMADYYFHDAAACLVRDGALVAAVEEERLNRIKKTTKFPVHAVRACLGEAGVDPAEIDAVGYYFDETFVDHALNSWYVESPRVPLRYARELVRAGLGASFAGLGDDRIVFTGHHVAHAESSFARSGMDSALVIVLDARGEEHSGSIFRGGPHGLDRIGSYGIPESLGTFYEAAINVLGYRFGDEYKVMGLAPLGDPSVYREAFAGFYELGPEGTYTLNPGAPEMNLVAPVLFEMGVRPRRKGEPFTQQHRDIAASLQEMLETVALHVIEHWARITGETRLCFTGGVAHNSTLNGRIARSGLFDEVFVHPASHDAGASEGAALAAARALGSPARPGPRLRSAALGPSVGEGAVVEQALKAWSDVVSIEQSPDVVETTVTLLADGGAVGWVQGRSEFGPRALGQRSILADPRPSENQTRINAVVKKRESFRPFAPAVTAEAAAEWFELPTARCGLDFMSFVVPVRPDRRAGLGAVTHVDGSARVQVVDSEAAPRFHRLIERFGARTGTPVLLNTSFNNDAEPIVQSVDDAVTSFLTTDLDVLIVEDFVVRRHGGCDPTGNLLGLDRLVPALRPTTSVVTEVRGTAHGASRRGARVSLDYCGGPSQDTSESTAAVLGAVDGIGTLDELTWRVLGREVDNELRSEIVDLWSARLITLRPEPS